MQVKKTLKLRYLIAFYISNILFSILKDVLLGMETEIALIWTHRNRQRHRHEVPVGFGLASLTNKVTFRNAEIRATFCSGFR